MFIDRDSMYNTANAHLHRLNEQKVMSSRKSHTQDATNTKTMMRTHTQTNNHAHACNRTHTHTETHTHTHTHTHMHIKYYVKILKIGTDRT